MSKLLGLEDTGGLDFFSWTGFWGAFCFLSSQEAEWPLSELLHSGLEVRLRLARDSREVESWAMGSGEVSTGVKG